MFLLQQNQRLENRCYTYELEVQRLKAEFEGLKKLELEVAELRERLVFSQMRRLHRRDTINTPLIFTRTDP